MKFLDIYPHSIFLFDAPMETRLQYGAHIPLGNDFAIFHLLKDSIAGPYLAQLYRDDIAIAQRYHLPIVLNMPTFRASERYLLKKGYRKEQVKEINQACFNFVRTITEEITQPTAPIFILAPVGPRDDAYDATTSLSVEAAEDYHQTQIQALATTGIDLIAIATMPSLPEAIGAAKAAAKTGIPYTVGFVVDKEARLLDQTPLHEAIRIIDHEAQPKPLCYILSCTHPSIAASALQKSYPEYSRLQGIKANGSCKSPAELAAANRPLADPPAAFGKAVIELARQHHWKIIGGCCGTNQEHLTVMAKLLQAEHLNSHL